MTRLEIAMKGWTVAAATFSGQSTEEMQALINSGYSISESSLLSVLAKLVD